MRGIGSQLNVYTGYLSCRYRRIFLFFYHLFIVYYFVYLTCIYRVCIVHLSCLSRIDRVSMHCGQHCKHLEGVYQHMPCSCLGCALHSRCSTHLEATTVASRSKACRSGFWPVPGFKFHPRFSPSTCLAGKGSGKHANTSQG